MKILKLSVHPYAQRFGMTARRMGYWIRLEADTGCVALGEAAAWPGFGGGVPALEAALADSDGLRGAVEGLVLDGVEDVESFLAAYRPGRPPELMFALESALLTCEAERTGVSLATLLAHTAASRVTVHALVGGAEQAAHWCELGVQAFKVKVARLPFPEELKLITSIREAIGPEREIWLDANGAWAPEEAARLMERLAPARISVLEQPVAAGDLAGAAWLRDRVSARVMADESVSSSRGLEAVLEAGAADIVSLKPMFLGGLQRTLDAAELLRHAGMDVTVTHALESGVGRYAATCVAAAVSSSILPCGLLGPQLALPVVAPLVHDGAVTVSSMQSTLDPTVSPSGGMA